MINVHDILETIKMIDEEYLDVRTITMGISLLDCCDSDIDKSCEKIYNKITRLAKDLVKTGEDIEREYGIPIINKRISVTPIAMLVAVSGGDPVKYAHTLERCAQTVGVNFIGGYSALVQKGCAAGDRELMESIPRALAETEHVCASVNVGSTKAGINMNAVELMGRMVKEAAELTKDQTASALPSWLCSVMHRKIIRLWRVRSMESVRLIVLSMSVSAGLVSFVPHWRKRIRRCQ